MTGNTHSVCGLAAAVFISVKFPDFIPNIIPLTYAGTLAGSLLPDIDIPQSRVGSKVRFISKHLKHRGITHTLLFPVIIAVGLHYSQYILLDSLLFGLCIGWLAHITADAFNKKGVPLFFPLTNAHIHIASFKTRSWHEFIFILLWLGGLFLCYRFL
jgi:inner membrane protein